MARWRIAVGAGIVVALAVVAAFVVSSVVREEPEVVAEPVAAPASPSPTATADPDPMPELHNTGDDFDQIYRSIEDFRNWLFRNPEPELVGHIYHPDCECFDELRESLETLVEDGVRFGRSDTRIHEITLLDVEADAIAVKVVDEGLPQVVVDSVSGAIVDRGDGWEKRAYRFLLVREQEVWVVRDIVSVSQELEVQTTPSAAG